jgi:hypothetical protein
LWLQEDVELPKNITWNDINVISFYCEAVMADLAHALLPPVSDRAGMASITLPRSDCFANHVLWQGSAASFSGDFM